MALSRAAYTPSRTSRTAPRSPAPQPKQYTNADGPGGSTIDYGPAKGPSQQERWQADMDQWGMSPWFGRGGAQMPWSGPDGQQRGQRTPFFTPDAGDPRNAGYWRNEQTPEQAAAWQAQQDTQNAARNAAYGADPAISAARSAGDLKGYIAAVQALKAQGQQQRFVDQGGSPETWNNRFDTAWPVPASRDGTYHYGPGRPGPTPPGVAVPPSQNSMFEGYGYQPGQSKSGGGQSVNYGGASTGQGAIGQMPLDQMLRQATGGIQAHNMILTPEIMQRLQGGMQATTRMGPPMGGGGLSPDIQRKLADGMPAHLLGLSPEQAQAATQGRTFPGGMNPVSPGGPIGRTPIGPMPIPPSNPGGPRPWPPTGGGPPPSSPTSFSPDLMSLFGLNAGGLNASMFGSGGFGMPGSGMEGMMRFGGYRPAATQGMMSPY